MKCEICITELWNDMLKKELLKELHIIVRSLNKIYKEPRDGIFGVCNKFRKKLTDYFFLILDLGTASFGNGSFFTQLK